MIHALAAYSDSSNFMGMGTGIGYGWFDPTYILVIIGMIITLIASSNVKATFQRFDTVRAQCGLTAAQVARRILDANGLQSVRIDHVAGSLTDHFSPKEGVIRLSSSTYNSTSIAAIGVAAHECGHAVQHQVGYVPIRVRNSIVPAVNICNTASFPIIMIGLLLGATKLAMLGVVLFCGVFAFQLVTIPTETNASGRALKTLNSMGILNDDELAGAKKVLTAAALTYFASAASTALQLLRLMMLVQRNNRRD